MPSMLMRGLLKACVAVMWFALGAPFLLSQAPTTLPAVPPNPVQQLWSAVVEPTLRQDVKTGPQAQNFGTSMMVPLQAAFRLHNAEWQHSFADHFARLAANSSALPTEDLGRLQYLYLASQFMVLAQRNGQPDIVPHAIPELLFADIQSVWTRKPAWQFEGAGPAFKGGVRERTLWKLNTRRTQKSYFREINDVDFYVFAIAADLKAYGGTPAQQRTWAPTLDDVLTIARRVFTQEVAAQPGGKWVLQPGTWTDHPEYQYAGNQEIRPGMRPIPVPGIAPDSSHTLRFPLWLTSLMHAYPPNSEGYLFYEGRRSGLEKQFFDRVLVKPTADFPCYRMTNFMDGNNGVYRWSYPGLGEGSGYGPYGLSSALLVGWWVFLDTDRIRQVYRDVAAEFPWPRQCVETYLGPTLPKGKERPASAYDPGSSGMRLWHLLVSLDAQL